MVLDTDVKMESIPLILCVVKNGYGCFLFVSRQPDLYIHHGIGCLICFLKSEYKG